MLKFLLWLMLVAVCWPLAIIGIVFLVLLILEAVGVIDVFKKFP